MNFSFDAFLNVLVILVVLLSIFSTNTRLFYGRLLSNFNLKNKNWTIIIALFSIFILEILMLYSGEIRSEIGIAILITIIPLTLFAITAFFIKLLISDSSR